MNSFELNKILGAILGTCLGVVALNIAAGAIFAPDKPAKPGYEIAVSEKHPAGKEAPKQEPQEDLPVLLAKADVSRGQMSAQKCAVCHTFDKGGANKIGPNLYGIVGEDIAQGKGYEFSQALQTKHGKWDVESLNAWLYKPQDFAKGTKMTFAGLPKAKDRADVVAYLETLK